MSAQAAQWKELAKQAVTEEDVAATVHQIKYKVKSWERFLSLRQGRPTGFDQAVSSSLNILQHELKMMKHNSPLLAVAFKMSVANMLSTRQVSRCKKVSRFLMSSMWLDADGQLGTVSRPIPK